MSRPLKILYMAHVRWFNAEAQYALDLALKSRALGCRVVYYTQKGSPVAARARGQGVKTYEESGFNAKGLGAGGLVPAMGRFAQLLRRERIDAVEVFRPEGFAMIAMMCRLLGIPAVRVRGDMRPVRKDLFNRLLHRKVVSAVVASNTTIAESLQRRLGPINPLETIHGGVDAEYFRPEDAIRDIRSEMGFPQDVFLVGILGRLGFQKGHRDLIESAAMVMDAGARVCFVILAKESTPAERVLQEQIDAKPGLDKCFGFLRFQEDLPSVLRAFDLGVVASTGSEANCRVGLEWMASGVPLLGTRVGVLPDLIDNGQTGFLVEPHSPRELGDRIISSARQPHMTREMGMRSRLRVLEKFTMDTCAARHLEIIRHLIHTQMG